jgi:integrase
MYNYALKQKPPVLDRMPCTIELLPVDDEDEADFYDHEIYERLVEDASQVGPRVLAAVLLGGDGGLRRNEVLALNVADIDFKAGQFFVRRNVFWKKGDAIARAPLTQPASATRGSPLEAQRGA